VFAFALEKPNTSVQCISIHEMLTAAATILPLIAMRDSFDMLDS
jgi:hypothetical protein